ncbi:MAG: GMC family oxidoreductase [Pseudomonadota bacterium]
MILQSGSLSEGEVLDADLCIVGAGAAGISMSHELAGTGIRVVVLESGFDGFDERAQSLYSGPNVGFDATPLDEARLRMLGGSSNHWAGNCMRLDPIDFEAREGVPYSGWPISRSDLDPYYLRAQKMVETPSETAYDAEANFQAIEAQPIAFDPATFANFLFAESPPTTFGNVYYDVLKRADNVSVYLNATALEIQTDYTASRVTAVRAAGIDGPRFEVRARHFILAQGGIEVARLLLLSNAVATQGLGNQNDLVGRFYMDHVSIRPALQAMIPTRQEEFSLYTESHFANDGYFRGAIQATRELLYAEQLPNFRFIFFLQESGSPGQVAAKRLKRSLQQSELPDDFGWHMRNMITDLDGVTNEAFRTISRRNIDIVRRSWIEPWLSVESIPNPDSRVYLIDERDDFFGQHRVALDWRLTEADLIANRRATEILAQELGRLGYGRVWSALLKDDYDWPFPTTHGKHHTGTTRMSADPKKGVVDADCRVHGISNLYIASSSVFPTQGHATPTLSIVALSLRLSDHLSQRLSEEGE